MAERIQRKRTAGWKMPSNTIYVGRPSRWGNPFKVAEHCRHTEVFFRQQAVDRFSEWVEGQPLLQADIRRELAGKDLACWCRTDHPCHADVLLRIANREEVAA